MPKVNPVTNQTMPVRENHCPRIALLCALVVIAATGVLLNQYLNSAHQFFISTPGIVTLGSLGGLGIICLAYIFWPLINSHPPAAPSKAPQVRREKPKKLALPSSQTNYKPQVAPRPPLPSPAPLRSTPADFSAPKITPPMPPPQLQIPSKPSQLIFRGQEILKTWGFTFSSTHEGFEKWEITPEAWSRSQNKQHIILQLLNQDGIQIDSFNLLIRPSNPLIAIIQYCGSTQLKISVADIQSHGFNCSSSLGSLNSPTKEKWVSNRPISSATERLLQEAGIQFKKMGDPLAIHLEIDEQDVREFSRVIQATKEEGLLHPFLQKEGYVRQREGTWMKLLPLPNISETDLDNAIAEHMESQSLPAVFEPQKKHILASLPPGLTLKRCVPTNEGLQIYLQVHSRNTNPQDLV